MCSLLTPKVFANLSPGFALKPWGKSRPSLIRNPERVYPYFRLKFSSGRSFANPFRVANHRVARSLSQGFKANPGLELANTFDVNFKSEISKGVRLFVVERPRLVRDDGGPLRLTTKPCSVFTRDDEGFDHLGVDKVSVKVDEFC